jgi:phenylalanyl-tRNA synthetase beta chain
MIATFGGGQLRPGACVNEARAWTDKVFAFRPSRARKLLGLPLDDDFCRTTVRGMGCSAAEQGDDWTVTAPSHRLDLEREVDIIEEVGRVYGLDRIPTHLPFVKKPFESVGGPLSEYDFWMRIKHWGRGAGLREAVNYSFVGQADLDRLGLEAEGRIPVKNPLSEDQGVLRTALAPGLLNNVRHNIAQGASSVRLFELAHIFRADADSDTTAREPGRLAMALYGDRYQDSWPREEQDADYLDLKGLVEHLAAQLGLACALTWTTAAGHPWLSPCVEVRADAELLGVLGRVRPAIAADYHARKDVWLAELDADLLARLFAASRTEFRPLPVFPPVRRDMTVIAPAGLRLGQVTEHIAAMKLPLLEDVTLIDVFVPQNGHKEGESGEAPERNLTLRLTFRHAQRTLKDKEVDKEREKVANSLMRALPVRV